MTVMLDGILTMEVSYLKPQWKEYIILVSNFIHLQIRAKYIYARNFMYISDTGITGTIGNQFVYVRYQLTRNVRIN